MVTETKEIVIKRDEYKENPQNGKVQLVYKIGRAHV